MNFKNLIFSILFLFVLPLSATVIESFDSIGGDVTFGGTPDGALLDPNNNCSNYPVERRAVYSHSDDATITFRGGSLRLDYTNKNNQGNAAIVKNIGGADYSAYDYAMFYVKSSGVDDDFYFFVLEDNGPTSGPWSPIDDVWSHTAVGTVNQTNWMQVLIPLKVGSGGFVNASESWNSICYTAKFQQYNQELIMTNVVAFEFAIQSPVASPSDPKYGTIWLDEFYLLYASEIQESSNPYPAEGSGVENPMTTISLNIGENRSSIRMIVDGKEYTTADSELDYTGDTVTFTPGAPFSGVVSVYVDAIDNISGVPIKAKKWWFYIGKNIRTDEKLLKVLSCPEFFNAGMNQKIDVFTSAQGYYTVTLFDLAGRKITTIQSLEAQGDLSFDWNGMVNGKPIKAGLYLLEFKYSSDDSNVVQRIVKTIQIGE